MNTAIILAGGIGSRVGADRPKQFVEILGKPVLAYTIDRFQQHPEIDAIEIVCVKSHLEYLHTIVKQYNFSKVHWITEGGSTFQHSVINGIHNLIGKCQDNDIVLIHYGASPFVSDKIISDAIRVCKKYGNSTSATPIYLLTGSNNGDKSTKWIDRDSIMGLNSPQCFIFKNIIDLYTEAEKLCILDTVEPHTTSLMYKLGKSIYFSYGNQTNIKITTKEDLELFRLYEMGKKNNHCP